MSGGGAIMYFDVSAQGERGEILWQNCPSHFDPIF